MHGDVDDIVSVRDANREHEHVEETAASWMITPLYGASRVLSATVVLLVANKNHVDRFELLYAMIASILKLFKTCILIDRKFCSIVIICRHTKQ